MQPNPATVTNSATSMMARKIRRGWLEVASAALEAGQTVRITNTEQRHAEFRMLVDRCGTKRRPIERGIGKQYYLKVIEKGDWSILTLMALPEQSVWDWAVERQDIRPSEAKSRRIVFPLIDIECENCGAYLEAHFDVQQSCDSCGAITFQRRWWAWNPALSEWCRIDEIDD